MAVQKSKKSISKKKIKISNKKLKNISLNKDKESNELHIRHYISKFNYKNLKLF